ncbi:hypothetical protein [Litorilituus lipolyticus]|uniref:Uncharacterized protein n=1 Tax=Litorilituus lipolyticus TaxID=2491017 RepID=A0A502L1F3_9GAMM|nr:hypothetical protein [Litorilituus lipolyticus]TPH14247.1 hypothetical protein EPA86_11710 [Litorilituus lipolyticus]
MKNILTYGWYARIFIIVLWFASLWFRTILDFEQKQALLVALIGLSNLTLYLIVAMRLPLLTHSQSSAVLPGFSSQLKTELLQILGISLLPTLLLLPNFWMWLGLISIMLACAMLMAAMIYLPKYQIIFFAIMLLPISFESLSIVVTFDQVMSFFVYIFPAIAVCTWWLLDKLVVYRKPSKHIAKMMLMVNASLDRTLAAQDHIPPESQNIFMRWWGNLNFGHERKIISAADEFQQRLSMRKLIAIGCHSSASFSRYSYITWSLATILVCSVALTLDQSHYAAFIPLISIVPAIIIGTASITLFQMVNSKSSYLARLSILPRFNDKQSFAKAFIKYILFNQGAIIVFIAMLVAITILTFEHLSWGIYFKVCLLAIALCLINSALMFFCWSNKSTGFQKYIFIIVFNFILFMLLILEMTHNGIDSAISLSSIFTVMLVCASLCVYTIRRYLHRFTVTV